MLQRLTDLFVGGQMFGCGCNGYETFCMRPEVGRGSGIIISEVDIMLFVLDQWCMCRCMCLTSCMRPEFEIEVLKHVMYSCRNIFYECVVTCSILQKFYLPECLTCGKIKYLVSMHCWRLLDRGEYLRKDACTK